MSVAPWIQIMGGRKFDYRNLSTDNVCAYDISAALGRSCRYAGRIRDDLHYSVAEHCVHMTKHAKDMGLSVDLQLWHALHDATEAYMPDFPRPWKDMPEFAPVVAYEAKLMELIAAKFELSNPLAGIPESVITHDCLILYDEALQVLDAPPIEDWHQMWAPGLGVVVEFWSQEEASHKYFTVLTDLLYEREMQGGTR